MESLRHVLPLELVNVKSDTTEVWKTEIGKGGESKSLDKAEVPLPCNYLHDKSGMSLCTC